MAAEPVVHRIGRTRFLLDPELAPWLVERVLPGLETAGDRPGAERVKMNVVRTVWRVPFDRETLYVKRYHPRGLPELLKYVVLPSRAAAEWRAGRAMREAGLPVVRVVMMGEERRAGALRDAWLATVGVSRAETLTERLRREPPGPTRDRVLAELGALIARMHEAGFLHGDLHGGNLLVSGEEGSETLHLLDLHTVRRRRAPAPARRRANAAKLVHSLTTVTGEEERRTLGAACGVPAGEWPEVLAAAGRLERRRLRSRSKRCLKQSSAFCHARTGRYKLYRRREVPEWAPLHAVGDHLYSVWRGGREVLKDSRRSKISRQVLPGLGVVVKETRARGPLDFLKNAFRRHRGLGSWVNGNALLVRGVGAARPLALLVSGRWPLIGPSWLLMEDLIGLERLDLFVLRRYAGRLTPGERQEKLGLVRAFGAFVGDLHRRGIYHGDLKAVNVFVERSPGGGFRFRLVDYDRVRFLRRVGRRRRVKNLAQLAASVAVLITRTDRLRFFRAYAADEDVLGDARALNRGVERACRKKIVVRTEPIE